jgi:predicted permease
MGEKVDGMAQDVRLAARWLWRRPGFSLTVIATLAIAVGANTAMFSVVNAVLLRDLPFAQADRLVTIWRATADRPDLRSYVAKVDFEDYRAQSRSFAALATHRASSPVWVSGSDPEVVRGADVSEGFFDVFAVPMSVGRGIEAHEAAPNGPLVVVVSWEFWQTRLDADANILERTLRLDGVEHAIVGVAPRGFDFPDGARVWRPEQQSGDACGRNCVTVRVIGRLAPGVGVDRAHAELNEIAERVAAAEPVNEGVRANVVPLAELTVGGVRRGLLVLFGAVGMVLLIACANVASLLFTSATERAGQMAVRKALGANRGRLIRQILTESAVMCALGGLLGLALAAWGVGLIGTAAAGTIPRLDEVTLDGRVLAFTFALMTLATLLFGLAPAVLAARGSLTDVLRGIGRSGGQTRTRGRSALIGSQVALSVMLLIGTGLLLRTLGALRGAELGFDPSNVVRFSVSLPSPHYEDPSLRVQFMERMAEHVAALPDALVASGIAGAPLGGARFVTSVERLDGSDAADIGPNATLRVVLPNYFEAMRIPVLQGRSIEAIDHASGQSVVVVSRAAAETLWPNENAVGKRVRLGASMGFPEPQARTVVGVVGDVRSGSLQDITSMELYIPHAQSGAASMTFVVRTRSGGIGIIGAVREDLRRLDPTLPLRSVGTITDDVKSELAQPGFYSTLLGIFALMALTLSAVGLYGLVAYQVARRHREIGIRMAMGARADEVVRLLARKGLAPAAVGLIVGLVAAIAASRLVAALLYGVAPLDPLTWFVVFGFMAAVAIASCVLPARRATRVEPTQVLRGD